ncbi:MAG TPA: alpha/beta hydrolase [Nevskiaceae bacterium]|nr:alpha/beta hydrolase [Nevskiaceae bacterium]
MELEQAQANGLRFAFLEAGSGPTVLLLHGYPDNAYSWEHQIPALTAAGYRVVAPFLRGYPPTEIPEHGYYDRATLALDLKSLIDVLNGGKPVLLVAQDWGASIAYALLAAFPETVTRAVLLAVPHPAEIRRTLRRSPAHVIRSFHWFLFQLPGLPERLCKLRDGAFLQFLWWLWSPDFRDHAHVARVREMMREPGAVEATLAYYRAMFGKHADPALADIRARIDRKISVPTLCACGTRDMRKEMLEGSRREFSGVYEWTTVEGAGHFLHREKPQAVNALILDWLRRED